MSEDLPKLNSEHYLLLLVQLPSVFYLSLSMLVFFKNGVLSAILVFVITWIVKKLSNIAVSIIYTNLYLNKSTEDGNFINPFVFERGRVWVMLASECTIFAISAYIVLRWVL